MDHLDIAANNIVDLYVQGRLHPPCARDFEEHFMDCSLCLDEIELAEAMLIGLRELRPADFIEPVGIGRWRAFAIAASVLLAPALGLSAWNLQELQRYREQADAALPSGAPVLLMSVASTRGIDTAPRNVIELGSSPTWVVLELEGSFDPGQRYRVRVSDGEDATLWQGAAESGPRGTLAIALPSPLLASGSHRIDARPENMQGSSERFGLLVSRPQESR